MGRRQRGPLGQPKYFENCGAFLRPTWGRPVNYGESVLVNKQRVNVNDQGAKATFG
jgi:hypothetical protein